MKVYIAAPWVRKADAIELSKVVTAAGHTLTSTWFDHSGDPHDNTGNGSTLEDVQTQAMQDISDVINSDAVIVLNLQKSEGKAVETGVALTAGIRVISVGKRSNIFQSLCTEVDTIEEAVNEL